MCRLRRFICSSTARTFRPIGLERVGGSKERILTNTSTKQKERSRAMPEKKKLNWDDVTVPEENLSDEEFKGADTGFSNVPPGKYFCECIETKPSERQDS